MRRYSFLTSALYIPNFADRDLELRDFFRSYVVYSHIIYNYNYD